MAKFKFPYYKSHIEYEIADELVAGVLVSKTEEYVATLSEVELVKEALTNPIGHMPLCELAKGKKHIVVISSDHTRPVPSHITMPIILEELRKYNPEVKVSILVATGMHRPSTHEELVNKYGEKIVAEETIVMHNAYVDSDMTFKGILPSGGELWVNKLVDEADLLISEGFIEPHFFAGFSGGRKSVLPGIASKKTVLWNHNAKFIANKNARAGSLAENPIHKDMLFAAKQAKLSFILNVVLNGEKKIIKAFAGDLEEAHAYGCNLVKEIAQVEPIHSDIVITTNGLNSDNSKNYIHRCIKEEKIYLAVPKNSKYACYDTIDLSLVKNESFIMLSNTRLFGVICNKFCSIAGFLPKILFESDSPVAVQNIISMGAGVAFWPEYSWGKINNKNVALIPISYPVCQRDLIIELHSRLPKSVYAEDFYKYLLSKI